MNLYELTGELGQAIQLYNSAETDEQLAELEAKLLSIDMAYKDKCVAVAHYAINLESETVQIDAEIDRLKGIKTAREHKAGRMRQYLKTSMEVTGTKEIDGVTVKLKIKTNPPRVDIINEALIPPQYKKIKTVESIDKAAIKASWEAGVGVDGTEVKRDTRLEIK